jgi:myo-inositol-1(or 4)-monophosphatase
MSNSSEPHTRTRGDDSNLSRELELARQAAAEAGDILTRYFRDRGFEVGEKSKNNPVTTADFEADARIKEILRGGFPDYGWLSEETADNDERLSRKRVWIVDPLDGTKEFIKGIPEFVISIALAEEGNPILGVTFNPIKDETFIGVRGQGVTLNGSTVRVTATSTLDHATVLASRSETSRGEWKAYEGRIKVNPIGSVAYKLALVAAGRADATFTRTPKSEWDIASGAALIVEAGGCITDIEGGDMRFNKQSVKLKGFVASNTALHDEIERIAVGGSSR